ncbi:DUF423 domain-containing protein [Aquirufa ecclesiirivi]|uniref:DUF423 domain-containing protein n=1 Tax=Aquirufa ecclesiirivi TaxID=2715124 RepID=UPI0022A8AC64|nr:DUF423 domain-containing protein [Aquirufa ecclesiirivi]MCZ2471672.1 DUF423 domain-containing protein [Aquirufa ecclesiirivi]
MKRFCLLSGSILATLSVAIGAFGAHAWKAYLVSAQRLDTFETASTYQMYGALALLLLGIWQINSGNRFLKIASYLMLAGSIIFPGALYLICITQQNIWGAVAPLGGLSLIVGFSCMAMAAYQKA